MEPKDDQNQPPQLSTLWGSTERGHGQDAGGWQRKTEEETPESLRVVQTSSLHPLSLQQRENREKKRRKNIIVTGFLQMDNRPKKAQIEERNEEDRRGGGEGGGGGGGCLAGWSDYTLAEVGDETTRRGGEEEGEIGRAHV